MNRTFHFKVTYLSEGNKLTTTVTTTATAPNEEEAKKVIAEKLQAKFKADKISFELIATT